MPWFDFLYIYALPQGDLMFSLISKQTIPISSASSKSVRYLIEGDLLDLIPAKSGDRAVTTLSRDFPLLSQSSSSVWRIRLGRAGCQLDSQEQPDRTVWLQPGSGSLSIWRATAHYMSSFKEKVQQILLFHILHLN